jgi:ubiquinone/menaquinone biosynthesis C-methylase UbiE/uncharacterized protein YbaR (Trm112 family)
MSSPLISLLCCPLCGGNLDISSTDKVVDPEYGVLTCYCGQYPIVAGIPIIKRGAVSPIGRGSYAEVVKLIEGKRYQEALLSAILPPPPPNAVTAPASVQALIKWQREAEALLTGPMERVAVWDLLDFYFRRSGGIGSVVQATDDYNYFVFRFSQPRHLVALSLVNVIEKPDKPVLDLACGMGHVTRHLLQRINNQSVIGLDRNFFFIYIAKKRLASSAQYVCSEADVSLPFRDGTFAAAFCSDAFLVFPNKVTCIRELKRLTQHDGAIVLVAVRNRGAGKEFYSDSLPPEGYASLVADLPHRLVSDREILARYLQKRGPSLTRQTDMADLAGDPWISLVASHRQGLFTDYGLFDNWPHAYGKLELNPLYTEEQRDAVGNIHLRRVFPSAWYEQENVEYGFRDYLPETVTVRESVLLDLAQGNRTPEVQRLIEQCVAVGMPERYLPENLPRAYEDGDRTRETIGGTFYIERIITSDLIAALIPPGETFILADQNLWGVGEVITGRRAIPFVERDGQYWGAPPDDHTAIVELDRLRRLGASFIVFGWPAIWWLDYYAEFGRYLYSEFRCVLKNDRLVIFDLRPHSVVIRQNSVRA